jgi:Flp pilus assembly secretin CpaC
MKVSLVLFALFFGSISFAATKAFDVKAEVSLDGKPVSTPHIVTKPNELASVTQKAADNSEIQIEMIATDYTSKDTKDGIMMKFKVYRNADGNRTELSRPQIVALPGEEAQIIVGKTGKIPAVSVKVVATRVH